MQVSKSNFLSMTILYKNFKISLHDFIIITDDHWTGYVQQ